MLTSQTALRTVHCGLRRFASQLPPPPSLRLSPLMLSLAEKMAALHPALDRGQQADRLDVLMHEYRDQLSRETQDLGRLQPDPYARVLNSKVGSHLYSLLERGPALLRTFPTDCPRTGSPQMALEKAHALCEESARSFEFMMATPERVPRALSYACLIHPVVHQAFGIALTDPEQLSMLEQLARGHDHQYLDRSALLALRHYTHPDSGAFNVYRAAHKIDRLCPELGVGKVFTPLLKHFNSSVASVHASPAARATAPLYRGMIWDNEPLPQRGEYLHIDRPTSASANPGQSYAGRVSRSGRDYNLSMQVHDGPTPELRVQAIDVAIFHPVATLDQEERLLLPDQVLRVTEDVRQELVRLGDRTALIAHCTAEKVASCDSGFQRSPD